MHVFLLPHVGLSVDLSFSRPDKKFIGALQWTTCFSKVSRHTLRQIGHTSWIWNNGILRKYLKIVWYSNGDIYWPNPSIRITIKNKKNIEHVFLANTQKKHLSCGHVKLHFYILNSFTKKGTRQNMLCFRRDDALASKTATLKIWNCTTKTIQNNVKISVHTWKPQKRTRKPLLPSTNPTTTTPTLIDKETNIHRRSPKKGLTPTATSSTSPHNSLSTT